MTDLTNETIGNYRVVQQLGEGGMGVVCLAQHPIIGRKVAIKLLHPDLSNYPDVVTRFFNEARAIHTIAHENIVEILDFGHTRNGQPYFIMEFLEGESLGDTLARGAMTPNQVRPIADQICLALAAAHDKGVVHRDLKPQNVQLVTRADGTLQVKLLDFGVAKLLASPEGTQSAKTRTGALLGTPLYMSPEQCRGARAVDLRSDIYSLGVMLFEMLAGRPPFRAQGMGELFAMHMFGAAPSLGDLVTEVPPKMAAAIMTSLAKDPGNRFQSMSEFRQALLTEPELDGPGLFSTAEPDAPVAVPKRKWRIPVVICALSLITTGALELSQKKPSASAQSAARPTARPSLSATPLASIAQPVAPVSPTPPIEKNQPPAAPSAIKKTAGRHARKPNLLLDEDDLATPSF